MLDTIGAIAFGAVIGWITYRTLRRRSDKVALSDIATVLGAVGGAGVVAVFSTPDLFGAYSIGLFGGFFGYLLIALAFDGKKNTAYWMSEE